MSKALAVAVAFGLFVAAPADAAEDAPPAVSIMELMAAGPLPEKALGTADAPVTIVEYASLTCPHCGNFYRTVFPDFKTKYVDTGKVRFILREFPLDQLALAAAMAARCAPEDKYFEIIDAMFVKQNDWAYVDNPGKALLDLVTPYGFTEASFTTCLGDKTLAQNIIDTESAGEKLGVKGTPAFFINGVLHSGEMTAATLDETLAPLLEAQATP
jgi:protein-disulfide isomerase